MNEKKLDSLTEEELEAVQGGVIYDSPQTANGSPSGLLRPGEIEELTKKLKDHPLADATAKENSTPIKPGIFK